MTFKLTGNAAPFPAKVTIDGKTSSVRVRLPWRRTFGGSAESYELKATFHSGRVVCQVISGGTVLTTSQASTSPGGTARLNCGAER